MFWARLRDLGGAFIFAAALAFCSASASAQSTRAPSERWLLAYAGSTSATHYEEDDFERLIGRDSGCSAPLFTGFIFLSLQWRPTNRWFASWLAPNLRGPAATGDDWQAYADSLVAPTGVIARLDRALSRRFPGAQVEVAIMVPYLGGNSPSLTIRGKAYGLEVHAQNDPGSLYQDWFGFLNSGVRALKLQNVRLTGAYWLNEGLLPGDSARIGSAAAAAKRAGIRLLWIPSYHAHGAGIWRELGFSEGWYQPNVFFDTHTKTTQVDSAAEFAVAHGLGLELEFDRRLVRDSAYSRRLDPYLELLSRVQFRSIAVYDGAGALLDLFKSEAPAAKETSRRLVNALCAAPRAHATERITELTKPSQGLLTRRSINRQKDTAWSP
jgi:hypothetical protein